jgi:hypothetical protein
MKARLLLASQLAQAKKETYKSLARLAVRTKRSKSSFLIKNCDRALQTIAQYEPQVADTES